MAEEFRRAKALRELPVRAEDSTGQATGGSVAVCRQDSAATAPLSIDGERHEEMDGAGEEC